MHHLSSARSQLSQRRINDRGELTTVNIEEELNKLPFSARTSKRSLSKLDTEKAKSKNQDEEINKLPYSARPSRNIRDRSKPPTNLLSKNSSTSSAATVCSVKSSTFAKTDKIQQAKDFIREGSRSCIHSQKNEIINKLGNLLITQYEEMDKANEEISKLTKQNEELMETVRSQKQSAATAAQNNDKIAKLRHLQTIKSDEKLIEEIKKIEEDSQKYLHLSEPWLLSDIENSTESDDRFERLINLKFRRLEDLIYGLRRQLLNDHDIVALIPIITAKFGTVKNLLAKYNEAVETINRYKVREFKLNSNELLKRRALSEMDTQSLYTLIVALQNELAESKALYKEVVTTNCGKRASTDWKEIPEEASIDKFSEKYNLMEANVKTMSERIAQLEKDNDLLLAASNLESDVLKEGLFTIDTKLKDKLSSAQTRLCEYQKQIKQQQETIDMQQKLISQFQEEKAVQTRKALNATSIINKLQEQTDEAMLANRNLERKIKAVRGLSRIIVENCLPKRSQYDGVCESLENTYINNFVRYDSAALMIQRVFRKKCLKKEYNSSRANPKCCLKMLKYGLNETSDERIVAIPPMFAIDAILGTIQPVKYRQVVSLIHSVQDNVVEEAKSAIEKSTGEFRNIKDLAQRACENVLCIPRRYVWTQTESTRSEAETQTEKLISRRTSK